MTGRVFVGVAADGLVRAHERTAGEFAVESALAEAGVLCVAADPLHSGRVYAGAQGGGVLRSDDRGLTWQAVGPLGPAGLPVKALAASPVRPDLLYAGTKPARLFVSRDAGASWDEVAAFRRIRGRRLWLSPAEAPFIGYVQAIALSPADPDALVVGIEAGATVMSRDGGKTWSGHPRGALRDCHSLYSHPLDGAWVYEAGGTGGGAAFSRDGGRTWTNAGQGMDRHYGWAVAADPADPSIWYVSVAPGPRRAHGGQGAQAAIFRRDGAAWRRLAGGLPEPLDHMPYALIADAAGSLYAGLSNGDLWHSRDRGESWAQLPVCLGPIGRAVVMV